MGILIIVFGFLGKTASDQVWVLDRSINDQAKALEHLATGFDALTLSSNETRDAVKGVFQRLNEDEKKAAVLEGRVGADEARMDGFKSDLDRHVVEDDQRFHTPDHANADRGQ